MLKCRACGFPTILGHLIRWDDNGTITMQPRPDFRVLLIEADFLTKLIASIEDELDLPVRQMVFESQRDMTRVVIDADLSSSFGLPKRRLFRKPTMKFLDRNAIWTGQGYCHTTRYVRGVSSEGIARNPFDRELLAANIVGAMETLEGVPYRHEWRKGDHIYVEAEPGGRAAGGTPVIETVSLKPGHHHFDRCARCDMPLDLRDLKWMEEEGIVMDIRKGVRMVFLDFYSFQAVVEKLARELGPSFTPIVVDTQRAFFLRHIWEEFLSRHRGKAALPKDELYQQVLDTLALRGQGNPVEHSIEGGCFNVTIENPFSEFLLAGFLSALYECAEERVPRVSWDRTDPQTLRFTLEPASS
jgi:hypothetical protein